MIIITDTNFQQILHCIKSFRRFNQFKLQDQIGHNICLFFFFLILVDSFNFKSRITEYLEFLGRVASLNFYKTEILNFYKPESYCWREEKLNLSLKK